MDLSHARVIVVVFHMEGCGACEEYLPVFRKVAEPYKKAGIPVLEYNFTNGKNKGMEDLATRFGVSATPTTVVARRGPGFTKFEGAHDAREVKAIMELAKRVHEGKA